MATATAIVGSTAFKVGAAAVTAAATVHGTVEQRRASDQARRESRTASLIEQEKSAVQNARNRRRAAAQAQAQVAQVQAQEASLAGSSSGSSTATGAIQSQTAGNVSFQRQLESLSGLQTSALNRSNQFSADAQQAQAFAGLPRMFGATPGAFLGQIDFNKRTPTS